MTTPSYVSPFTGDVIQPTDVSYQAYTLQYTDLQLEWPSTTIPPENVAARIMDITALNSGLSLIMPPGNQVSVGQDALIRNLSANAFTVKDYNGGTIISIAAGEAQYIYVTDNTTAAGTWGVIAFGIGSSAQNANALAGLGLVAIATTLNQSHPASVFPDAYTFTANDRAQTKVWVGGAGNVYLPLAADVGNNWFFIFKNNGTGTLSINTQGTDQIDLQPQKTFQPDDSGFIICDGTGYVTVGYGQSPNFLFTALVKPVTGGTYVLTTPEATSVIQEYVGNLTNDVVVVYPPVVGLYVVSNQTIDNGYSLTITTGVSGGSNAIVPANNQASLICDGTNFFNANTVQAGASVNSLTDGTETAPSLNFAAETSTGIYRPSYGNFGITILGTNTLNVDTGGAQVTGDLNTTGSGTFAGGVSGGTF